MTRRFISNALLVFLVGCASQEKHVDNFAVKNLPTDNPGAQIAELETNVSSARERNVELLSPNWFRSAEKSLREARAIREKGGDEQKMFRELGEGRAQIQKANDFAEISRQVLSDALDARGKAVAALQEAKSSGAVNLEELNNELSRADERFKRLASAVEDNAVDRARDQKPEVIELYRRLEAQGLRKEKLSTARRILEEAEKRGAKKWVPRTYDYAQELFSSYEKFISHNPNARREIDEKGDEVVATAQRLLHLTDEARQLSDVNSERRVLYLEHQLSEISDSLKAGDLRSKPFEEQLRILTAKGKTLLSQADQSTRQAKAAESEMRTRSQVQAAIPGEIRQEVATLEKRVEDSEKRVKNLESKKDLVARLNKTFTPDEAEILERGDKIVVRLKGIRFKVGSHELTSNQTSLLSRINATLQNFPDSSFIVEGHTDSTGSAEINEKLSQARAEEVKRYLLSNMELEDDQIRATGKGFRNPISSNKTPEGRAANRRIDIIIAETGESEG